MQAICFPSRGEVLFGQLPDPDAGKGEVVIQVKASGICHTDFEVLKANYGTSAFPVVPGHEFAGVVVNVGPDVKNVVVGDRVVVDPNIECGKCRACRKGWAHLCETLGAYGVTQNGGFAEFSVVKASALHSIGEMDFTTAALAEPMGCVLNGVDAVHDTQVENALIFGAGPMGLLVAIALETRGVSDIAIVDIDEARLQMAAELGFKGVSSGSDELRTYHQSVDISVDATGVPSVAGRLVDFAANGGKVLFFGVCPSDARIEVAPFEVFRRQLTLAGTHSLNHNIPKALEAISASGDRVGRIISHQVSLEDVSRIMASSPPRGTMKIQAVMG